MEENSPSTILEGKITGISFSLATRQEICLSSISDCPISHASQLSNPFLGLPLEVGKCESCGTAEPGKCEGHFGYIELPIPIYHPSHIGELKRILSLICLKCLKFKNKRLQSKNAGVLERAFAFCCEEAAEVTVIENLKKDGACFLELKLPSRTRPGEGFWDFLSRYGYRYGDGNTRPLLPSEVLAILKKIPEATKKKLAGRGCMFQEGYIMQHLPVPPNCLSTPDVSDGISVSSSDISMPMLRKVLRQVEIIKSSRSGNPNFESLEVEVNDLQLAVAQYLQSRGAKASPDRNTRYQIAKTASDSSSTKAWLEKMKTLFISKGSGFSSRSVITGDPYKGVGEIGIPYEIAQRITFEERVTEYNMKFLQKLVDDKLCLTYKDGQSTYSLREGSKGHTFLKPGQIVHRKIMDGDVIFINRPPTTHKHSLQALSVYIHDDHTFKINPLICGPLSADFDGDCIHIFYPQSPEAKAEVLELFAVEKQLLSSHSGHVNLQLGTDSVLSLKTLFKNFFLTKAQVQQLAIFTSGSLPKPSMLKARESGPLWTVLELLETSLPPGFDCVGDKFVIRNSKILKLDYSRDVMQSIINEIISSVFFTKGPKEVLNLFNSLQPMLMENLCSEGFNLSLEDFIVPKNVLESIESELNELSSLLYHLRSNYNEVIALQLDKLLRVVKNPISDFILRFSSMGNLIDSKSDAAVTRIVQQIGFLGLQIYERGRLYSRTLIEDLSTHFVGNYPFPKKYPFEEFGLIRSGLFHGLDPYQEMVHSIASREVMVRSSRGLTEPGTLFKNSMAILRDVVICYDGTVRNVCSNSIIQFEYGAVTQNLFAAGEPVGVLAATAMSNPAYKAVLDSSPNSNSSWNMMKEILQCGVNFKNVHNDRRVVLYLNDCDCGEKHCLENAAFSVKNHLRKVSLKDVALEFLIEYTRQQLAYENAEIDAGLVGHIHLNKKLLSESNISMEELLSKCEDNLNVYRKKKKVGQLFKNLAISCSECSFQQSSESRWTPCLKFFWQDSPGLHLEKTANIFADAICPVLLNSVIKGDPRVKEANITWISPETTAWIRNPSKDQKGELAIDVVLEKEAVKKSGDAWRTVMDACLPIIHLIDTTRSIPYAIKQVEDLLGIACAFEQAVQRLSTSVSMVSKGMLKEHLLLLASSMTCAGFLVGFNLAGIKALNKTLNFQVPFSEATVYTPKRCFERAAEKCHADSLSSIVAACSWGKPVAVGTGSRFDILWDTREIELNQKDGTDVYNFLHLVGGGYQEEADSGCLGELDSYDMEDNYVEAGSPEPESAFTKPVFEDELELNDDVGKSTWAIGPTPDDGNSGGGWGSAVKSTPVSGGWGEAKSTPASESGGGWGQAKSTPASENDVGWGQAKSTPASESGGGWGGAVKAAPTTVGGWGEKKDVESTSSWGSLDAKKSEIEADKGSGGWGQKVVKGDEPAWGKKVNTSDGPAWGEKKNDNETDKGTGSSSRGSNVNKSDGPAWGGKKNANETEKGTGSGLWGQNANKSDGPAWGGMKSDNETEKGSESGPWGQKVNKSDGPSWGGKKFESEKGSGSVPWGQKVNKSDGPAWGGKKGDNETEKGFGSGSWGQKAKKSDEPAWGEKKSDNDTEKGSGAGSWGQKVNRLDEPAWGGKKSDNNTEKGSGTGSWGQKVNKSDEPTWGGKKSDNDTEKGSGAGSWGQKVNKSDEPAWGGKKSDNDNEKGSGSGTWGQKVDKSDELGWGEKKSDGTEKGMASGSWGKKDNKSDGPGWGSKPSEPSSNQASSWGKPQDKFDSPSWNAAGKVQSSDEKEEPKEGSWNSWGKKKENLEVTVEDSSQAGSRGWDKKAEPKPDQGGGWKKKEGWGPKRDQPARPERGPNTGPRYSGPFTATRQRYDIFNAEEQEILAEIEPIMLSIRRIMHQSGYEDGIPFSADDQKYIIDNVFAHHPEKTQKEGAGVDHIMANKHTKFQDTRCLFVVSTDGRKEDFSYKKCLENFVRLKYPDKVEEFMPKYFRPPRPRRDEAGAGTPRSQSGGGWKRDSNDESGTPRSQTGWGSSAGGAAADGGSSQKSGWGSGGSQGEDGGGTPKAGWGTGGDGGGTQKPGWGSGGSQGEDGGGTPKPGWGTRGDGGGTQKPGWGSGSSPAADSESSQKTGWETGSGVAAEGGSTQKSGWGS